MMNKSLLNLAVLCGTASFGQLPNAIEIAPKGGKKIIIK